MKKYIKKNNGGLDLCANEDSQVIDSIIFLITCVGRYINSINFGDLIASSQHYDTYNIQNIKA